MLKCAPIDRLMMQKWIPDDLQMIPKGSQNDPQMKPKWPPDDAEMNPRWSPNDPESIPKKFQMKPKWPPDEPPMIPNEPQMKPRRTQMKHRWLQERGSASRRGCEYYRRLLTSLPAPKKINASWVTKSETSFLVSSGCDPDSVLAGGHNWGTPPFSYNSWVPMGPCTKHAMNA